MGLNLPLCDLPSLSFTSVPVLLWRWWLHALVRFVISCLLVLKHLKMGMIGMPISGEHQNNVKPDTVSKNCVSRGGGWRGGQHDTLYTQLRLGGKRRARMGHGALSHYLS